MNRGSGVRAEGNLSVEPTSMRPRFMNRGSALGHALGVYPVDTSMRPRFMNRGSVTASGNAARNLELQ